MPPRSREQLEAELRVLRNRRLSDGWASVATNVVRWGGLVGIAYFTSEAVKSLAGQQTAAAFVLLWPTEFKVHVAIPWVTAVAATAYGLLQRHLKNGTVKELHAYIKSLERRLDPNRSSSGLTSTGETRPEDRL